MTEEAGETDEMTFEEMVRMIAESGAKISFSRHCISGLIGKNRCQCWRCRKERGEEVTPESNREAAEQSLIAHQVREVLRMNGKWEWIW